MSYGRNRFSEMDYGINDAGEILGKDIDNKIVILTPIPEPATFLLLGFGAVILRRKRG